MAFHSIIPKCPQCGAKLVIENVGVSPEFAIAINYHCTPCKWEGAQERDLCEIVASCRESEGVLLQ